MGSHQNVPVRFVGCGDLLNSRARGLAGLCSYANGNENERQKTSSAKRVLSKLGTCTEADAEN